MRLRTKKMTVHLLRAAAFSIVIVFCCILMMFFMALPVRHSYGRDLNGQYDNDPNHSWFERQKNQAGGLCCEIADGHRIEDADWGWKDGHYWIRLDGKTFIVPDEAVIDPKDRPVDYAVVWIWNGKITCFMSGAGS